MDEKLIEKKLREGVKQKGGIALKFFSPYFTGMPDRIVLLPEGKTFFVELKSPGKKPKPRQKHVIGLLFSLGFITHVIDNQEDLVKFLKHLDR